MKFWKKNISIKYNELRYFVFENEIDSELNWCFLEMDCIFSDVWIDLWVKQATGADVIKFQKYWKKASRQVFSGNFLLPPVKQVLSVF